MFIIIDSNNLQNTWLRPEENSSCILAELTASVLQYGPLGIQQALLMGLLLQSEPFQAFLLFLHPQVKFIPVHHILTNAGY